MQLFKHSDFGMPLAGSEYHVGLDLSSGPDMIVIQVPKTTCEGDSHDLGHMARLEMGRIWILSPYEFEKLVCNCGIRDYKPFGLSIEVTPAAGHSFVLWFQCVHDVQTAQVLLDIQKNFTRR